MIESIFDIPKYIEVVQGVVIDNAEITEAVWKINPEYIVMAVIFIMGIWLSGTIIILFLKGLSR